MPITGAELPLVAVIVPEGGDRDTSRVGRRVVWSERSGAARPG